MKKRGFEEVYQIKGGIVRYGDKFGDDGLWDGSLFIFDDRMHVDFTKKAKVIGECEKCSSPTNQFYNCANKACHKLVLLCESCAKLDVSKGCGHTRTRYNNAELIG